MLKFALLGEKLGHSYSPLLHRILFAEKGIDASYELLEIKKEDLKKYIDKIRSGEYQGFNVTIPYKIECMQYLDYVDDIAKSIGAVNTIYLKDGKVCGTNTDYYGFLGELKYYRISPKGKNCYVLGTGGASLAITKVLEDLGGYVKRVSRNPNSRDTISYSDYSKLKRCDILINTTPVGMYPNILSCPLEKCDIEKADIAVDVIFNPQKTVFVACAKKGYGGLMMLLLQGAKSEDIWLNQTYDLNYSSIFKELKRSI